MGPESDGSEDVPEQVGSGVITDSCGMFASGQSYRFAAEKPSFPFSSLTKSHDSFAERPITSTSSPSATKVISFDVESGAQNKT